MNFRLFSFISPLLAARRTKFTTLAIMSTLCVLCSLGGLSLFIFDERMVSGEHLIDDIPHSDDLRCALLAATKSQNKTLSASFQAITH